MRVHSVDGISDGRAGCGDHQHLQRERHHSLEFRTPTREVERGDEPCIGNDQVQADGHGAVGQPLRHRQHVVRLERPDHRERQGEYACHGRRHPERLKSERFAMGELAARIIGHVSALRAPPAAADCLGGTSLGGSGAALSAVTSSRRALVGLGLEIAEPVILSALQDVRFDLKPHLATLENMAEAALDELESSIPGVVIAAKRPEIQPRPDRRGP